MDLVKKNLGEAAAKLVLPNMIVGLGTGSTANTFIDALGKRCSDGLVIKAVSSSLASEERARSLRIPLVDMNDVPRIDLTVDGADQVDKKKRMIKGRGGSLFREKILASSSDNVVIIIDETKLVEELGKTLLPVEITLFGAFATKYKLEKLGFKGSFRLFEGGSFYITDNGNLLLDIVFPDFISHPEKIDQAIAAVPGVVETGFFFHLANTVLIGQSDGKISSL